MPRVQKLSLLSVQQSPNRKIRNFREICDKMDVQFKARSLWNTGKEVMVSCTKALSNGVTFGEVFSLYAVYIRIIVPSAIDHFFDCFFAYFLFHFYLLYVLIFSVSLAIIKNFKTKGAGIAPVTGALKEKAGMYLTYFFVIQSVSKWTFGVPTLDRLMGWAFQVKPQINFKPQIKIGKSKSAESVISVKSKVGTALHVGFESDDETTGKTMKKLRNVKRKVDFVAEMADAVMGSDKEQEEMEKIDTETDKMIQKWLESSEENDEIKKHVQKIVAENVQMRRQSLAQKSIDNKASDKETDMDD